MPDEDPRAKFRAAVLDGLREMGERSEVLDAVRKVLASDEVLDKLFVRSSASFTVTAPSLVFKAYEAYFGPAATAFASRPASVGVQVQGNMEGGVVVGRDIRGTDVSVAGKISAAIRPMGDIILRELQDKGVDVKEADNLLTEYDNASDNVRESFLTRFAAWARTHAGELSSNGIAALSVILAILKQ